jgi:hypothetical protein
VVATLPQACGRANPVVKLRCAGLS